MSFIALGEKNRTVTSTPDLPGPGFPGESWFIRRAAVKCRTIGRWILALGLLVAARPVAAEQTAPSGGPRPFARIEEVAIDQVRWTDGFWSTRQKVCRERSIPEMGALMRDGRYKPFLENFLVAAGTHEGQHHGAAWNDGDFYKWIEAATAACALNPDPQLSAMINESISAIASAQRADGYLHTPTLIRIRNGDQKARPFEDRANFEMYNLGHLMTAACIHYQATGSEQLLQVARRAADFLDQAITSPTPELARNAVCPAHYMGIIDLYRTTGDPRYLDLARRIIAMRRLVEDGGDDNQDRIPFLEQREAVGHAVRANYLYAGMADLYLETGEAAILETLEQLWENVVSRKLYVTGGCGALYDGASPDGSSQQSSITRVHQAYGRNYQLPNTTAHNETCAAVGSVLWNWRMYLATGEARFVNLIELTLYNAVLTGVSLEGTDYSYVNPLRNTDPLPTPLRWSRSRVPFVTSYCCPPNVVRTLAQMQRYAYAKQPHAVLVNLYGANTLRTELQDEPLWLTQTTDYPWVGTVLIHVDRSPSVPCTIALRIPDWADEYTIRVNQETLAVEPSADGYARVERQWRAGDDVSIEFPLAAQLIESHPLVEETRGQVAVKRGPVVYCLESCDLPTNIPLNQIHIDSRVGLQPVRDLESLDGVVQLDTNLVWQKNSAWGDQLYRPRQSGERSTVRTRLIPYFTWGNRGEGEMSVWLPLAEQ